MLALDYILHYKPTGIESLILSSTLSSASLWASEQHRMICFMSETNQRAIEIAEKTGNYESEDYITVNAHFMHAHCAGSYEAGKAPNCLTRPKKAGKEAYLFGWGPNEYTPTGSLASFEVTDELKQINIPTLIISGTNDLCAPLVAKTMHDNIKHSTWELFPNCRHMVFAEATEQYIQLLQTWLKQNKSVSVNSGYTFIIYSNAFRFSILYIMSFSSLERLLYSASEISVSTSSWSFHSSNLILTI